MKFVSIRQKLITRVSVIFLLSFLGVLSLVAYLNVNTSQDNQRKNEADIRSSLIAKGKTLVSNNSQALRGLAEDNAFTAVQALVAGTVRDDDDVIYGIYMDVDRMPWVSAMPDNPEGTVAPGQELGDEVSRWAAGVEEVSNRTLQFVGSEVYEFAAPVRSEGEILGFIRYGITTKALQKSLKDSAESARQALMRTMLLLVGVGAGAVIIGILSTRTVAGRITEPLQSLTRSAETIAAGDYAAAIDLITDDEIGLLAQNFESMRATIKKKMADLAKLNSTGEVLASLLDQNRALEEVLKTMHEQIGVGQGSVYLINEEDKLEVKVYYPPKKVDPDNQPARFAMGEGVLGRAAAAKQIVFVPDTAKDERFVGSRVPNPSRALLCVPLLDEDVLLGVMNFSGEVGAVAFGESDREFAASVARLLVITLKNIRMREVIAEQNRTLELKVQERTAELQQKTNDIAKMLAHMHQGLFTVMEGGVIHHEYAAYLEQILETRRIDNRNFMDLLFANGNLGPDVLNQIETAVNSLLGSDEIMFDFNAHLLVREFTKDMDDGRTKILELDWDPIAFQGEIEKIMVTVRDVTALKALQREAEEQKQELEIIGQILALEPGKFDEFLAGAKDFIGKCRMLIEDTPDKDEQVVNSLFRYMHTIKGNARTYGFGYITDTVHEVEHVYDRLRKEADLPWLPGELLADLARAERAVGHYGNIAKAKLGRLSEAGAGASIDHDRAKRLLRAIEGLDTASLPGAVKDCLRDAYTTLITVEAKPLSLAIADVIKSVKSLALELGKPEPVMEVDDGDILIQRDAHGLLSNAFLHVFRNAVDHGIEPAEERQASGKPVEGHITLHAERDGDAALLVVRDDGRGLAIERIYRKAVAQGVLAADAPRPSPETIANLIFAPGFSTAEQVTAISGRGVGLDAVKRFLEQAGGGIEIRLDAGSEGDEWRRFSTRLHLPPAAVLHVLDFA